MRSASWMGVLVVIAACHRQPAPQLEYGETVTYTSTAADPAPRPAAAANATTRAPLETAPAAAPAVAQQPEEPEPAADAAPDGDWTTTVHTGEVGGMSPPSAPAEAASAPARVDDEPSPPDAGRPAPRQWYKAKSW